MDVEALSTSIASESPPDVGAAGMDAMTKALASRGADMKGAENMVSCVNAANVMPAEGAAAGREGTNASA
jgi:hypothetical protein